MEEGSRMLNMKKRLVGAWLIFVLVFALGSAIAEEGSKGILYRVENGENTVYLLGSIHVGNETMYPLGEVIQTAMESADIFVFECDTSSVEAGEITLKMMFYTDDTRLKDTIPPDVYQKLQKVCKLMGYREQTFQKMRPWAAMAYFSNYATGEKLGVADVNRAYALGVEEIVRAFALKNRKSVGYLETTQGQMEHFESMSAALQSNLLDTALSAILHPEDVTGMDSTIEEWPVWWREGKGEKFAESYREAGREAEVNEEEKAFFQEYSDIMLTRRNLSMTDVVEGYLTNETAQTYFVTAGLLHVVLEEDGIVGGLKERGYVVENLSGV